MPGEFAMEHVRTTGIIAILRGDLGRNAISIAKTLITSGITAIEVPTTSPKYAETISCLVTEFSDRAAIGAGTVLSHIHLQSAVIAGATFVVSPNTNPGIIRETRALGLASFPGAYTPSEIVEAAECGADAIKLFPAGSLGPGYIRALRGPFPDWRFIPTGGIHLQNMEDFMKSGAFAVGIGSELVGKSELTNFDADAFFEKAKSFASLARKPYES
jgi:2-dehydro-3-deoxyphosphogluconate aldolase / (4S)-4-hydroxy-2-oxoglutarate aldolase